MVCVIEEGGGPVAFLDPEQHGARGRLRPDGVAHQLISVVADRPLSRLDERLPQAWTAGQPPQTLAA